MDLFNKLEVNISLLELVKRIPRYTKVLKDLCAKKRIARKKLNISPTISALFEPLLPTKCKDPNSFTIPCMIGKAIINGALLDLGEVINVMPKSIYESLDIKTLKGAGMILKLTDKSSTRPLGIIDDVLVNVKDLVFPADIYVLDMDNERTSDSTLILGRLFLRTTDVNVSMKERESLWKMGKRRSPSTCAILSKLTSSIP